MGRLKKKHAIDAELSGFYGFDTTSLQTERRLGLYANMPAVQAQRVIQSGRLGKYDAKDAYHLCLAAGKSRAYAEQVYSDLRHAEMEAFDKQQQGG